MRIVYTNTPLIEAVFEFAPQEAEFEASSIHRLDSHFKSDYAGLQDEIHGMPITLGYKDGKPFISHPDPLTCFRRWNSTKSRLIQF